MFLSGVSEIIIKRVGCWSSEAFLEYIREQVDLFTLGVSQKMLENESFHHMNERNKNLQEQEKSEDLSSKSDGTVCHVPFNIHYSKSVLSGDMELLFSSLSL